MTDDPRTESLREWNRLARENAENAMVSSMYDALLTSSEPIDLFSSWLLLATATVASFFIVNTEKVAPFVETNGFKVCGIFLIISCIFGIIAKAFAVQCKVGRETGAKVRETFSVHLANHNKEEQKIKEGAQTWGITLDTGIRMDRILQEYLKPAPIWIRWITLHHIKKHQGNPQMGYMLSLRQYKAQCLFVILQVTAFLAFLVAGFAYAKTHLS